MSKRKASKKSTDLFIDFANKGIYALPGKLIDQNNRFERLRSARTKTSEIQTKLRRVLDGIIRKGRLTDSKELQFFTTISNQYMSNFRTSLTRV